MVPPELLIGRAVHDRRDRAVLSVTTTFAPMFSGENRDRNQRLVEALRQLAIEKGATASQLAIDLRARQERASCR